MDLIRQHQLDIMLMLSGVCFAVSFFGLWTHEVSKTKRISLLLMGVSAAVLLLSDRFAYIYRGDVSSVGYWMVRICNFLVFFLTLFVLHTYNMYLTDFFRNEVGLEKVPMRLRIAELIAGIGEFMVIISQFTGFYYTFDETNHYQRAAGFPVCYIIPLVIWVIQLTLIIQYYKRIENLMRIALTVFTTVPLIASLIQVFTYGVSLTNMTMVGLIVMLRVIEVNNTSQRLILADKHEKEHLLQEQENMRSMVKETAYALAEAIEAKDKYTHGHSSRVAQYSIMIAKAVGKSEEECQNIYLAGMLHDVGKIGVPENIINKDGKLTDEEFSVIKTHPVIGNQILQKISKNPSLSIGAHYHHERYDGKGYPDGLKGEEIPEIARIIAVADAYDAMTSKRSYRDSLPQDVVREQIVNGIGTQFDPEFARIMLDLIDRDTGYSMRE